MAVVGQIRGRGHHQVSAEELDKDWLTCRRWRQHVEHLQGDVEANKPEVVLSAIAHCADVEPAGVHAAGVVTPHCHLV